MKPKFFLFFSLYALLFTLYALRSKAEDVTIQAANLKVLWSESSRSFAVHALMPNATSKTIVSRSKPYVTYDNVGGEARSRVTSDLFQTMTYKTESLNDEFGSGTAHIFSFTNPTRNEEDRVALEQVFYLYDRQPFILTAVRLVSSDGPIRSNHMEPISTTMTYRIYEASENNRMIKVPYDNDGFTRYHKYKLSTTMLSYETTAIYAGEQRYGAIFGSVDHDHWKSGISVDAAGNGNIRKLQLISGIADKETRDVLDGYTAMEHGKVVGDTVCSARFLIGFYDDWRSGMESYANACVTVAGRNDSWTLGTPFGWQSWGVLAEKNSYAANIEISDYYATVLQPGGFVNGQGTTIFSLDANDNHTSLQKAHFISHAKQNNQLVGSYSTPFSLWWDSYTPTGDNDVVLTINGKPLKYDGAYCADPTHPNTLKGIRDYVRNAASKGIRWIKADFVNAGMIQADRYYDPKVTTAVEAYNVGMRCLRDECQAAGIFLALSISPLFPSQYGNSRRIACDTWGLIGQTEYSMNAISAAWWTDHLYQYNDPDHLVLIGAGDQGRATEGENRARITNGAITGMMLLADNFSPSDQSGRGNNELSRQRAQKMLLNRDINRMADLGRSFRPVYGYREYDGNDEHAENFFVHETDSFVYLAVINYASQPINTNIPLSLLEVQEFFEGSKRQSRAQEVQEVLRSIEASFGRAQEVQKVQSPKFTEVKELWRGTTQEPGSDIAVSVPGKDACVYRLRKQTDEEAKADFDPNFHIYLCFGQSNMEGVGTIESVDKTGVSDRFKMMAAVDFPANAWHEARTKGQWYKALPPLCRHDTYLTPLDYFGRTMTDNLPDSISIGVIDIAIGGCDIRMFEEEGLEDYLANTYEFLRVHAAKYDNNPFRTLVNLGKEAQKKGVIKGILMHHGEANDGDGTWIQHVRRIYNRLCAELELNPDSVPLLAGETLRQDKGGINYGHNRIIAVLSNSVYNTLVVSSEGCSGASDGQHFTSAGYRLLGMHYAQAMLDYMKHGNSTPHPDASRYDYLFPLKEDAFNPSLVAVGTFTEGSPYSIFQSGGDGCGGWLYPKGIDISDSQYLVVRLNSSAKSNAQFHICDVDDYLSPHYTQPFTTNLYQRVNLKTMKKPDGTPVDASHIYIVGISSSGASALNIRQVFLSDDGTTPSAIISPVVEYQHTDAIYDLSGRMVTHMQPHHILITGGKKLLIK